MEPKQKAGIDVVEGNTLIHDWMGNERTEKREGEITWKGEEKGTVIWASHLRYHSSWDALMPVVEKIEQITLKEVIGVAASKPYWENDKLSVSVGSAINKESSLPKEAKDYPACFTINGKESWIQYYFTSINGGDGHFHLIKTSEKSKIESTWQAVIEFIKWHNQNPQP